MKSYKDCPFHPQLMMGEIMKEYCGARILTDTHGLDIQNMRCLQDACILVQQQKEIEKQAIKLKYICKVIIILMEGLHASDFNKLPAFKDKELCNKIQDLIKEVKEE